MQAQHKSLGLGLRTAVMGAALCGAMALPALGEVAVETTTLGDYTVQVYLHPFLTEEDLGILRLVSSDMQFLTMFVPQAKGHSALAASPEEGFVKDGVPVPSAAALGGLDSAETAAKNTIAACQNAAKAKAPCVVILQVSPK